MREVKTGGEGGDSLSFHLTPAVTPERMVANMRSSIARCLPEVKMCKPHPMLMSIAGGGPSIEDTYRELTGFTCAVNGSLQWLLDRGVKPNACGVCDAGEHIADMVPAVEGVRYYVASVCDPSLFDKLEGQDVQLWHVTPNSTGAVEAVQKLLCLEYDEWHAIGGGCTMGLRWLPLGYYLGFRRFHFHGVDSCFRDDKTHAYPDRADGKERIEFDGRMTRPNFLAQLYDFSEMLEFWMREDCNIKIEVFGDGLIPNEWRAFREAYPEGFK